MIVVTGATGFLGAHILQLAVEKYGKVRAIARPGSDFSFVKRVFMRYAGDVSLLDKVEWVQGDILDYFSLEQAFEGAGTVIHCAATVSFWKKRRAEMYRVNADGTANVVNAALHCGVKDLLFVSSIAALGRADLSEPVSEKTPWKNSPENSWYAVSKNAAEREVWRGSEEGLNVLVVNPGVILGYADWERSSGRIFKTVAGGLPFYTGGSNGFVDVRDVAAALFALYDAGIRAEKFVLVAETRSFKDLLNDIASALQVKAPARSISAGWLRIMARFSEWFAYISGREPAITPEVARTSSQKSSYDNRKIQEKIGFRFTPLSDTIQHTAALYLEEKK